MTEELEPYTACKATSEEEKKIKSSLSKFRSEAHPIFQKFRAGSISFTEMKDAVRKLESATNDEISTALGPDRHKLFMDSLTGTAGRT
jgi:hypothetical protein